MFKIQSKKIVLTFAAVLIVLMTACSGTGSSESSGTATGTSSVSTVSSDVSSDSSNETVSSTTVSSDETVSSSDVSDSSSDVSDSSSDNSDPEVPAPIPGTGEVFAKLNDFGQKLIQILKAKDYDYMNDTFGDFYNVDFTGAHLKYIAYQVRGKYVDVTYTVGNPGITGWNKDELVTFRHEFTGSSSQGYILSGAERIYEHVVIEAE